MEEAPMADNHPTGPNSPRTILVVDDDDSNRLLCATSLKKAGYHVLEAAGSSEAMNHYTASSTPIDLLLTDLFLPPPDFQLSSVKNRYPRVNGHDLVPQILSLKNELHVLFMSSHAMSHLASQGIMIEPERFLPKPFSVEQLLARVAAALATPPIRRDSTATQIPAKNVQWVN
jgi:CheY-like chemotaxis protein